MNRYTQITPSQFNPLSLEEVMLVPSMKRKQHDDTIAKQEGIRQKLAEVDPLDVHNEEAIRLRESMNNKLDAQAQQLASQGVSNGTQGDFLALNREYQNLTGPTGRIGQINNAKKVYAENFKNYMEDATKNKKWSREQALNNWQNVHAKTYTGYDDENKTNITNINDYGAPEKIELMEKLKDIKSILGEQVVNEIGSGNYSITPGPNGSMQIVNRSGRRIETSNDPNIQHSLKMLTTELYDPNSSWNKSIKFEGLDPSNVWNQTQEGMRAMRTTKVTDNRGQHVNLDGYKNQADWNEQNAVGQLIENTTSFLPTEFSAIDYKTNENKLQSLIKTQSQGNLTKEQNIELDKLKTFQTQLNNQLKTNEGYQKLNTDFNKELNKTSLSSDLKSKLKNGEFINTTAPGISGRNRTIYIGNKLTVVTPQELNEINKVQSTLNNNIKSRTKIENNLTKENSVMTAGYGMFPTTKKEETEYGVLNTAFFNNLKTDSQALRKYLNIETVDVSGQSVKPSNNDKEGLSKLFSQYGEDGKIVSFIPKGFGGKPEYIIEFKTGDNKYDMDGVLGSGNENVGGTVRMKVSYNKVKGNKLGNVNAAALNYMSNKGEINPNTGLPIGNDIAKEAKSNIFNHSTYNDIMQDQSYQWQNDQQVLSGIRDVIIKDQAKNGVKSVYNGVTDRNRLFQIFMSHHGDEFITK